MPSQPLLLNISGPVATLTLNRPHVHNAVSLEMMDLFEAHLDTIEGDKDIRVVVITGCGEKTFCAGGDLGDFATLTTREACLKMSTQMQNILQRLYDGPRVVIAAVNGQALGGGCEILTACHFRIAASHARFAFRQAANGLSTGWGGGERLLQRLREADALRLLLTAETINAEAALRIGLVDEIVSADALVETVEALSEKILANSSTAVASFLELARAVRNNPAGSGSELETNLFADNWVGEDFRKFLKGFLS